MPKSSTRIAGILLAAALAALPLAARAQEYPSKPLRLIVPVAAAGMTDIVARIVARKLQDRLGQSVVVENKAGGGGNIGTESVVRSAPDGYTLLYAYPGPIAVNPWLTKNLGYDPLKDLAPVSLLVSYPMIFAVHPSVPATTIAEFIAAAKKSPQPLTYGSAGNATTSHLIMELFAREAGIQLTHVPYKGAAPAVTAMVSGETQFTFSSLTSTLPMVKAGRLRVIAMSSLKRSPLMPSMPTVAEAGYPGFEAITWYGVFLPAGAAPAIVGKVNNEIVRVLNLPDFKAWLAEQGAEAAPTTPDEFATFIKAEIARYAPLVKKSGMKPD